MKRKFDARWVLHLLLGLGGLIMVVPFVWMILTSLKSRADIAAYPPQLLPTEWVWSNYQAALDYAPFGTYFRNSLLIAIGHTVINLMLATMAGYALARVSFRGRTVLFMAILAMMMIPTYTKIVPQYLIAKGMPFFGGNDHLGRGGYGWLDSWWVLIVPGALTPFAIFLFRQFYLSLPRELEEAARIDGMGEFGIFARVMTPLVKPAVATVALVTFENSWNNFLWPLLVTTRDDLRVIQVGLAAFQQAERTEWSYLMAGSTLATVPMIVLFLFAQRYFVQGFATAGIK
ncbi:MULTISPECIES: carbohydrate ABC transporter permease [Micromonosporaceae]|uniref:carbohydrate ABC transporter permease n=1 Tax=Micromonosporaceae TaxID=28056 RepID=UPI00248D0DD2|nr:MULTISPECIES: carbohydrate ABC transporter permease [unclassified Solwaraspora]WBB98853.1 carbohydrate ABC transporter permease [Solwaraspora sp. WMMA2059]WBC22594.1 carbohydrate ABC transporter permease [Solwaraspora sp. WMMA2080]WFE19610.1 carbohydrate ABC transporter permease [Solwaraspora sp. WMMD937]WJK35356.1 carbohydrate ABC transporter permease [Solwaraspora sp. WMMA2065]